MTVSISELERIEREMTAVGWKDADGVTSVYLNQKEVFVLGYDGSRADVTGICAMRNAFPVLLRLARAAMEYYEARKNPDSSCSIIDARYSALISALWNAEVQP